MLVFGVMQNMQFFYKLYMLLFDNINGVYILIQIWIIFVGMNPNILPTLKKEKKFINHHLKFFTRVHNVMCGSMNGGE